MKSFLKNNHNISSQVVAYFPDSQVMTMIHFITISRDSFIIDLCPFPHIMAPVINRD